MAGPGGFSYKPNVNRSITQKWKDATQVSYGGDDWGDDDDEYGYDEPAPVSAGNARHPGWQGQSQGQGQTYPSNRSVTNPSPSRSAGRSSFGHGDDRRNFSTGGAGGFESAYPTAQRNPFPDVDPEFDQPQPQYPRHAPPLSLQTQGPGQGPYPPAFPPGPRGQQRPYPEGPFSAPGGYPHRRSESGNRPGPGPGGPPDLYQRRQSPVRPDSRSSNTSGKNFPPRKSSLSQARPPDDIMTSAVTSSQSAPAPEEKATPVFTRPADIYKRIEQEREKERRSQDSSRPSIDLNPPKTRDSSTSARSAISESREPVPAPADDSDSTRRLKPTLDTVVERKSEYGFDNLLKDGQTEDISQSANSSGVHRHVTDASSVYTDRPDPVSASSVSRNQSLRDYPEQEDPSSAKSQRYNLPSIDRMSSFGTDLTSLTTSAAQSGQTASMFSAPENNPPVVPAKDGHNDQTLSQTKDIDRQPSLGYRSVVHQAFDESQNMIPSSAISGSNTIPRSNSQSTSDVSPIISRGTEHNSQTTGGISISEPTIPEEPSSPDDRPMSTSTITPAINTKQDSALPAPPAIHAGYRRDVTPPSRDNSPAKRPLSVETGTGFVSQHAAAQPSVAQSTTAEVLAADEDHARGRQDQSVGSDLAPTNSSKQSLPASPLNARTTSEEYEVWRNEKKQFNSKFGFQDSNPTTPGVPSPVSRAESPPKGTVRGMTERLEPQSGRSTLANASLEERPGNQTRMESFRPSIPGGWQSFTATPGAGTPLKEETDPLKPPTLLANQRYDSSDSIPTAKAPTNWDHDQSGDSGGAFAAAAAAGTALAGAFSGPAFSHHSRDDSHDSSDEDEWNKSPVSRSPAHPASDTRDFAVLPHEDAHVPFSQLEGSKPPTPLPKDTPAAETAPDTHPTSNVETPVDAGDSSRSKDYFPAPLRTSRSIDPQVLARPPVSNTSPIIESTDATDNDRLQQEIVKSLTPKSSNVEAQPEHLAATKLQTANDDDLYGSGPASPTPATNTRVTPGDEGLHQSQPSVSTMSAISPQRPLFAHRFSWETDPAMQGPLSTTKNTDSPRQASSAAPESPPQTPGGPRISVTNVSSPSVASPAPNVTSPLTPNTPSGPQGGASLRKIMNIGNHQARMDAYAQNRDLYAHSDHGLLDQWILSMRDTPDHADIFTGRLKPGTAAPSRPSPGRALPSISGGKMMPEDGKKLMAAAGRFGGKAGGAAKGLFARGKEKLRQASAGDKGPKTTHRVSAGPSLLGPDAPQSNRSSILLTAPPQIPAQDLSSSPIDTNDWELTPDGAIDGNAIKPIQTTSTNNTRISDPFGRQSTRDGAFNAEVEPAKTRDPAVAVSTLHNSHSTFSGQRQESLSQVEQDVHSKLEPGDGEGYDQVGSYMPPSQRASRTVSHAQPESRMAAGKETQGLKADPTVTQTEESAIAKPGLTVPDEGRRHSIVSEVSSASPSPAKDHGESQADRGVSPAEENLPEDEMVPSYDTNPPSLPKEQEAMMDQVADDNEPLPSYDERDSSQAEQRRPRIAPGAPIMAVADLSHQKRMELNRTAARPFSFDGSEILNQAQRAAPTTQNSEQPHTVPSQPMSPISQTLSKSLSQVSVEEVSEDQNAVAKRQSRSYSRPFGTDPVRDHPALRQPAETVDRSQMYSTESPLPSARRPQPEAAHHTVQSPSMIEAEEEEEGYRIPGPYRQEYRSPRQNSFPKPQTPSPGLNSAAPASFQQPQTGQHQPQYSDHQPQMGPHQLQHSGQQPGRMQQPMNPPPRPEAGRPKKSGFGGLFRNRSNSRPQHGSQEEPNLNQRNILRRNSRQDSVTSHQSSLNEARDVVGQLPPSDHKQRRFSRDLMRSGASTPVEQAEGKKKRFSAMGLFSRGSKGQKSAPPQRSSTLPYNSNQPLKNRNLPQDQQHIYGDMEAPSRQFQGSAPPVGGYYAPQGERSRPWDSNTQYYPQDHAQQQYQQRPADLRIDTTSGSRDTQSLPATAPPQTYANRDISYQSRPYVPPNARLPSADPGSIPRGPSPRVVDLHKRSRSPKLGRHSEDEERGTSEQPAGNLGTFINKKISPVGGIQRPDEDQEAPFRIALPGERSEDKRRTRQLMIEQGSITDKNRADASSPINTVAGNVAAPQTVAERMAGPQVRDQDIPGNASAARAPVPRSTSGKGSGFVAELPGSKAEGYESEEDVQMSATAYPGQWQDPIYFAEGKWDD